MRRVGIKNYHILLFVIGSAPNESLGFSLDTIFGHYVRGPLEIIKRTLRGVFTLHDLSEYVSNSKKRLHDSWECAKSNSQKS